MGKSITEWLADMQRSFVPQPFGTARPVSTPITPAHFMQLAGWLREDHEVRSLTIDVRVDDTDVLTYAIDAHDMFLYPNEAGGSTALAYHGEGDTLDAAACLVLEQIDAVITDRAEP